MGSIKILNWFIVWIAIQMVLIGMAFALVVNEVKDGSYVCGDKTKVSFIFGAVMPLIFFTPEPLRVARYCAGKE